MEQKASDKLPKGEQERIKRRAFAAYYADPETTDYPDREMSGLVRRDGLHYVVLQDQEGGLLACYRVRHDGKLKQLKQVPDSV
ncbi:MAG: hypothetical protein H6Q90_2122 [Deltaproteobacteria bacterium]|nr:hypothetical protein [Deltaproteobacteria bacterium]